MEEIANKDTFFNLKKKMEAARARPLGFRMLKPRHRWRVLIRRVIQLKSFFNFAAYTSSEPWSSWRQRAHTGGISPAEKALLRRPIYERSEDEKDTLSKLFSGLKNFKHYPEHVRRQLAAFVQLEAYEANRVIIRQGHRPEAMYFVCSGTLEIWYSSTDPVLGEEKHFQGNLGVGDDFGSLSLLRNLPRSRTIISKTVVELLLLRRQDFDTVLKATIMKEWALIRDSLAEFPYFDGWNDTDIQDICMQSKLSKFSDGETILGDGFGVPNMSYFITEGAAVIVQHLILVHKNKEGERSRWGTPVKCMPLGTKIGSHHGECVFMQVAEMEKGACFSFGESMEDRRVVAKGPVKIMLVPLYSLTSRNRGYLWTRIRDFLNRRLPQQEELFRALLNGRDWMAYRKEVRDSLPTRPGNHTTIHDVPLSYRAANDIPTMRYSAYTLGRLDHPKKWQWILKKREKALQEQVIASAKLEFRFDQEFMKKFGEQAHSIRKEIIDEEAITSKEKV